MGHYPDSCHFRDILDLVQNPPENGPWSPSKLTLVKEAYCEQHHMMCFDCNTKDFFNSNCFHPPILDSTHFHPLILGIHKLQPPILGLHKLSPPVWGVHKLSPPIWVSPPILGFHKLSLIHFLLPVPATMWWGAHWDSRQALKMIVVCWELLAYCGPSTLSSTTPWNSFEHVGINPGMSSNL